MLVVKGWNLVLGEELSCHVPKEVLEKFSFSELDIKKVKFFTQSPLPNFFALTFLTLEVA